VARILAPLIVLMATVLAPVLVSAEVVSIAPEEVRAKAIAGEIVMIDIRSFEEVAESAMPDVALLVDKTAPDFAQKLAAVQAQAGDAPVAVFCRRGGCAEAMEAELLALGFVAVLDVAGGFYGDGDIPGWGKLALPIRTIDMGVNGMVPFKQP